MKTTILFLAMSLLLAGFVMAQYDDGNNGNSNDNNNDSNNGNSDNNNESEDVNDNGNDDINEDINDDSNESEHELVPGNYTDESGNEVEIEAESEAEGFKFHLKLKGGNLSALLSGLNLSTEMINNVTNLVAVLSNGRKAEVKVMPDTASATALARIGLKVCNESNNCQIELKEVGTGNQTKAAYEVQVERHARILGIFETKMQVKTEIDAEDGSVLSVGKPWWSFLATEPEESA